MIRGESGVVVWWEVGGMVVVVVLKVWCGGTRTHTAVVGLE